MERKLLLVLSGALVLAAGAVWFLAENETGLPKPEPNTESSPSIASVIPELSAFVERARGRRFLEEVKVRVLSEPMFNEELEKMAPNPEEVARSQAVLTVLGLLPPETDFAALLAASDQPTVGFYDPANKELVTRAEVTPFLRRVLVHELTHALDDQHFGIGRGIAGDEAAAAFKSLIEGSAIRVERLYVSSLPAAVQDQIQEEEERIRAGTEVPPAVEQLLGFPYVFGPAFVEALLREGADRLDQAFSSPPTSSEQVLDPARYLSGDAPRVVTTPRAEGAAIDDGEIGPLLLRLLLDSRLDPAVAEEAATGWDGDRYVTWRSPDGRTCLRAQFAVDAPEDASQLQSALAQWVSRVTDREVDSAGLLLKACGHRQ
ncbi:MAG TPA: hypothetical protein VHJ78_13415 [Actinomycetota bacterium]|nr:hypothetical protein [Actinomycetota bacterium]